MSDGKPGKRALVRRIALDTGYSESSIYKILANPFGFSKSTVEVVRVAAERYGLSIGVPVEREGTATEALRIAVVLPARPLYFWREAVLGMERSKVRMEQETGVVIRMQYAYYSYPFEDAECERILSFSGRERPDALILFPVEKDACRRFLEANELDEHLPVILFNDVLDYMTDAWFDGHPHVGSIGPDGYDEGASAAHLIRSCAPDVSRVSVVCSRHDSGARTSEDRVRGICETLASESPKTVISHVELDPTEPIAPATLARRLLDCYPDGMPDCVYISSGVTHIAAAAVEKLERRLGMPLSTFVIGHECSAADKRYLLEGRQRGYIKQDIYTQGAEAVRDAVQRVRTASLPARRLYRSSVFIR